ncbi:endospore germination permease [Gorillibacterium sp. CAU 1737]|uniref:GerAB/ArcD/ProY family transporter n=1 Tax=Gorillibacterium sp. CAU 1737 TaxID=3140362 RepID=UPI0032619FB6
MQKTVISERQFAFLVISLLSTASLINLPHVLIELSGADAAFSVIFMLLYGLLMAAYMVMLSRRYPRKNLFEIHEIIFGRIFGTFINVLLLLRIGFVVLRDIRLFNFFTKVVLLPRTPTEILLLLFFIVLFYYGSTTLEVSARVNELFYPLLLLSQLILPLLLINQYSFYSADPYFVQPPQNVGMAGIIGCTWFGDIFVMGAFLQMLSSKVQMKSAFRFGVIVSSFIMALSLVLMVMVFGANMTAHQVYPNYSLAMQLLLTDFLDRLEFPFLAVYFPVFFINTAIMFIAMLIGIGTITRSRDYTRFNRPFGLLVLLASLLGFRGAIDLNIFANYGLPFFVILIEPLAILTVLTGFLIKQHREKRMASEYITDSEPPGSVQATAANPEGAGPERESHAQHEKQTDDPPPSTKPPMKGWSHRTWTRFTNVLIGLALAFVAIGFVLGMDYQDAATFCTIGFHLCLLIAVYSSAREARRAKLEPAPSTPSDSGGA